MLARHPFGESARQRMSLTSLCSWPRSRPGTNWKVWDESRRRDFRSPRGIFGRDAATITSRDPSIVASTPRVKFRNPHPVSAFSPAGPDRRPGGSAQDARRYAAFNDAQPTSRDLERKERRERAAKRSPGSKALRCSRIVGQRAGASGHAPFDQIGSLRPIQS